MAKQPRRDIRALLAVPQHLLSAEINERLNKLGFPALRPAQAQLLMLVEPGGLRLTSLVDSMGLPKQTLGDMVDDLETMKMVERYPDPEHGVIKRVRLGSKGRAWAAEVRKVAETSEDRWSRAFGKAKMKALRGLLEELATSLENGVSDGPNGVPGGPGAGHGKK